MVWPYACLRSGQELYSYMDWMHWRLGEPGARMLYDGKQAGWAPKAARSMQTIMLRGTLLPMGANLLRKDPPWHLVFQNCLLSGHQEWALPLDHTEVSFQDCEVLGYGATLLVRQLSLPACLPTCLVCRGDGCLPRTTSRCLTPGPMARPSTPRLQSSVDTVRELEYTGYHAYDGSVRGASFCLDRRRPFGLCELRRQTPGRVKEVTIHAIGCLDLRPIMCDICRFQIDDLTVHLCKRVMCLCLQRARDSGVLRRAQERRSAGGPGGGVSWGGVSWGVFGGQVGFGVWGLGSGVWGLGFGAWVLGQEGQEGWPRRGWPRRVPYPLQRFSPRGPRWACGTGVLGGPAGPDFIKRPWFVSRVLGVRAWEVGPGGVWV